MRDSESQHTDEIRELRRCAHDLVSLAALPAIWINYDLPRGLQNLADVLWTMLRAEIIYIRVKDRVFVCEAACTSLRNNKASKVQPIGQALAPWLESSETVERVIPHPLGIGTLSLLAYPIVSEGQKVGIIAVCAQGLRFPNESDRLLLSVGATQVGILLTHHQAQQTLRESERRYELVTRAAHDAIWDWDLHTNEIIWNEGVQNLFGYLPEEVGPDATWRHGQIHPEDRDRVVSGIHALIQSGKEFWSDEYRYRRHDGSWAAVLDRGYVVHDETGTPVRMIGSLLDMTDRRRAEERIQQLNEQLRRRVQEFETLLNTVPVGIGVATDPDCRFIWGNPEFSSMLKTEEGQNISKSAPEGAQLPFRLFRDGRELAADELPMQRACREGRDVLDEELEIIRSDGTRFHELCRASPLLDASGHVRGCIGAFLNITARKRAEEENRALLAEAQQRERELREKQEQLVHTAKLASIGELATGLAHELNNPLNNIGLFLGNVLEELGGRPRMPKPREALIEQLEAAMTQVRKAGAIITHLRTFARPAPVEWKPISINETIRAALALLREQLRLGEVKVGLDACPANPLVLGSAIQLEQVFLNLLTNARDAVEQAAHKEIAIRTAIQGDSVEVVMEDTGPGIPAGCESRIFDPFFTTKEVGKGTGLGLSITYSIVKAHRGTITAGNRPGAGACLTIRLPLFQEVAPA